ncbi:carbonic anhydrase Nec1-like isoform X1 [Lycium barbarum]|uniref:carbonic anhydrase Nec1-like isoform X1 n=2 Tax=Lycium barbarum TaxID=112863 RepID=UPI00293F1DC0|nr:carbonic anhydrase Nec1-like isoform X1 [Lycium barbarum]
MRKHSYYSILVIFGSVLYLPLFLNATSIGHHKECHDEVEFDYIEGSKKGPSKWGELKKEWETCNCGKMQSPIDISSCNVKIQRKLDHKKIYKPCNSTIKNRGHAISLQWHGDAGSIWMNGTKYSLLQIHWHSPSEHTINGRRYALELHMVHQSTDEKVNNKIVVNAVLYKLGLPDPFLFTLGRHIFSMMDQEGAERNLGMINPNYIANMHSKRYYEYKGSLTTPPCTEGVTWIVNNKVQTVSIFQVMLLRKAVLDYAESNARPQQPLNNRQINLLLSKH